MTTILLAQEVSLPADTHSSGWRPTRPDWWAVRRPDDGAAKRGAAMRRSGWLDVFRGG